MQDFVQSKKSVVRVCAAKRSNESPSGAFKRQNGLAQQDGRAHPDKFAFAQRSGAMKAPVGLLSDRAVLRQQDGGASPRQAPDDERKKIPRFPKETGEVCRLV